MSTRIKLLYLILALLLVYTLWPSSTSQNGEQQRAVWNLKVDESGRLEVLGITLGLTTLQQAEAILRSRSQRAIFAQAKAETPQPPDIEAFFPSMPDNSKLVLSLAASQEQLETIAAKARDPIAFPSGSVKLEIADQHMPLVDAMVIDMLTSIPRIRIKPADIEAQFGKPVKLHMQDDVLHYLYPQFGLDVILDKSGEALLQFVNPGEFHRVLEKLGLRAEDLAPPTPAETPAPSPAA
ncbi:MAG: hypothetical protein AB1810_04650 [Pseudomonadota bacterium]